MEDSGSILCQISCLKDMLDQVNEEIEANIQITREIESEIVRCEEIESGLVVRESELTKTLFTFHFEITGLLSVTGVWRNSVKLMEEQLCDLRTKRDGLRERIEEKREKFTMLCREFQRSIDKGENDELIALLPEREFLESEIHLLDKKNNCLRNSMSAFVEEVLGDLYSSSNALDVEIQSWNEENEKLLKDIQDLNRTLVSTAVSV
ncbi:hypothetical protein SLE2022_364690 [Rubroshorea leprosula]